ncbi:MAG: methionine adenosyltransferase [Trueperaceae bacterium]|nr:MAG: methionine adenosyltransferase [Trueperaceae bacterium]
MAGNYVFTSESVTEGHPDKLCDQISDTLVSHYLRQDPLARVIAECAVSTGILFVSVKAVADATVDVPNAAREVILDVGYDSGNFNGKTCAIMTSLSGLPLGERRLDESGMDDEQLRQLVAKENVTVFGYACEHTPPLMPLPIWLAHKLVRRLDACRKETLGYLAPDGKCQVGIEYQDHTPVRIDGITLVTSQREDGTPLEQLRRDLREQVIEPVFAGQSMRPDPKTRIVINPEGPMLEGGPDKHAGLTGRKNGVDTYGGFSRQSEAALSGKDPTRIDRIGAYAARHAAKNIVAAGLAARCEVQLSYSIGLHEPVSVRVESFGTGRLPDDRLAERLVAAFDFRLGGIIRRFDLRRLAQAQDGQLYRRLAVYGHVGRADLELPWESTADVEALAESVPAA